MIVVHPGSLCGSAEFNLGAVAAEECRQALIEALEAWEGDLLVLDGFLSEELDEPGFGLLGEAIEAARNRAPSIGVRLEADDPDHPKIALEFLEALKVPRDTPITLAGAWFDPSHRSGCINALHDTLAKAGFSAVTLCDSAARLDFWGATLAEPAL